MSLQYSLESLETSVGGKRALIVTPDREDQDELVMNIDTFQGISISAEKADLKRRTDIRKTEEQLKRAEEIGDEVAVDKLRNQLRFGGGESIADQVIKFVNMFLDMLQDEDQETFYKYLYNTQTLICQLSIDNNSEVSRKLTELTTEMMNKIDLATKLIKFTEYIKPPLPDGSETGNRSHHSASKTFAVRDPQQPDYLEMTAISFFAKLMFPVWGQYCHKMKQVGIGSIDKEFYCLQFCEQGIDQSAFRRIYNKFKEYVYSEVRRELDKSANHSYGNESNYDKNAFILGKNMYDEARFKFLQLAKLIIKRLATFNTQVSSLKGEDNVPNIMIFLQAIIKKNVANTLKQFNSRSGLLTRDEPRGSDDDNFTFMENCSRISKFAPDHPIYIRKGIELSIPREIKKRGLKMEDFEKIVEFYHGDNLPIRNVFSDSILSIFLFPIIGGSVNLNHLKARQYIMGLAYCQMLLLSQKSSYGISLALMLSSKTSNHHRANKIDKASAYIRATSENNYDRKQLMTRYPQSCDEVAHNESIIGSKPKEKKPKKDSKINIASHIAVIADWVVDYDHYVNVCPLLWRYFPHSDENPRQKQNDILRYSGTIMEDYCRFILETCKPIESKEQNKAFWEEVGFK